MSNIEKFQACEISSTTDGEKVSARNIGNLLLAGDRVMIEPIGEVFLIKQHDGPPEVEFVFENKFIETMIDLEIERLERHKQKLRQTERVKSASERAQGD